MVRKDEIQGGLYPRLLVSAGHGSAGKTTLTVGLLGALRSRGLAVQPFKKGPDFIDPLWHSEASLRTSRNLDFFISPDSIRSVFLAKAADADLSIIEGNKGLFDGMDVEGSDSSSALARHLEAPVLLVLDCTKITRGIAPLLQGYLNFEKDLNIAGVVLNKVAGIRHEEKLRKAVERYTDAKVLGALHRDPELEIKERHLGLVPSPEHSQSEELIQYLSAKIKENLNLDEIINIASSAGAPAFAKSTPAAAEKNSAEKKAKIAVARDEAFCFYYPENLEELEAKGAELLFFSPLRDKKIPSADALYFGGGFPEMYSEELSSNSEMLESVRQAAAGGMPVYAECGGLMYLSEEIQSGFESSSMAGILPAETAMNKKPQGRGYISLETKKTDSAIWKIPEGRKVNAHEFHYSQAKNLKEKFSYCYSVKRGHGIDGSNDGIIYKNIFASYAHLNCLAADWWAEAFINAAVYFKKNNKSVLQSEVVVA